MLLMLCVSHTVLLHGGEAFTCRLVHPLLASTSNPAANKVNCSRTSRWSNLLLLLLLLLVALTASLPLRVSNSNITQTAVTDQNWHTRQ
jgi:hypothetical protein